MFTERKPDQKFCHTLLSFFDFRSLSKAGKRNQKLEQQRRRMAVTDVWAARGFEASFMYHYRPQNIHKRSKNTKIVMYG